MSTALHLLVILTTLAFLLGVYVGITVSNNDITPKD